MQKCKISCRCKDHPEDLMAALFPRAKAESGVEQRNC